MSVANDSPNSNKYSKLTAHSNAGFGVENELVKAIGLIEDMDNNFPKTHWASTKFKPSK